MDKIAIYCSASSDAPREFNEAATALAAALCKKGYGIVSGGSFLGTMGAVSDGAASAQGYHKGVLPRFMDGLEYGNLSELVWTETMSARKEEMRRGTVASIALPGGIGTLDELVEVLVLKKLGQYDGRVIALNLNGFFAPLQGLLDHYVATGMLMKEDRQLLEVFDTPEELLRTF